MGIELDRLATELERYGAAYAITVSPQAEAHVVEARPVLDGQCLAVVGLGSRTRANLAARPTVTLVWPPAQPGDYSLIVDGTVTVSGDRMTVAPTRAVLHRSVPRPGGPATEGGCASDCVEL